MKICINKKRQSHTINGIPPIIELFPWQMRLKRDDGDSDGGSESLVDDDFDIVV
jgi:hypothetical protein